MSEIISLPGLIGLIAFLVGVLILSWPSLSEILNRNQDAQPSSRLSPKINKRNFVGASILAVASACLGHVGTFASIASYLGLGPAYKAGNVSIEPSTVTSNDEDIQEFLKLLSKADSHEANNQLVMADANYEEALLLGQVPIAESAKAMMSRAKIIFEEGRTDEALGIARIAAPHRDHSRDDMNIFGRILIDRCEFEDALIWLSRPEHSNDEAKRLIELANSPNEALSCLKGNG